MLQLRYLSIGLKLPRKLLFVKLNTVNREIFVRILFS